MVSLKILAGGYTTFVTTYLFDTSAGTLRTVGNSVTGNGPSWLASHPTNASVLYAVNDNWMNGFIQSFTVNSNGLLSSAVDTISSQGRSAAHLAPLPSGEVAVVNYDTGTALVIPTTDPLHFSRTTTQINFPVPQGGQSHPHMVLPRGNEILIPDLGANTVVRLGKNGATWGIRGTIPQPAGSGPRHIAVLDNMLYTLHELSSTLGVQALPESPSGASTILSRLSTLPPNPPAGAKWSAAELLIPATSSAFPTPYIYASNRNKGQNTGNDSIAVFERVLTNGAVTGLRLVGHVFTGLSAIRGMQFSPVVDGQQYLVAAGENATGGVVVYKRVAGGLLTEVARNHDVQTRTGFVWL